MSPIPGIVDRILIKDGDIVKAGDSLLVITAMKMEVSLVVIKINVTIYNIIYNL